MYREKTHVWSVFFAVSRTVSTALQLFSLFLKTKIKISNVHSFYFKYKKCNPVSSYKEQSYNYLIISLARPVVREKIQFRLVENFFWVGNAAYLSLSLSGSPIREKNALAFRAHV